VLLSKTTYALAGTTWALVLDNTDELISQNTTVVGSITTHHNVIHNNRIIIQVRGAVLSLRTDCRVVLATDADKYLHGPFLSPLSLFYKSVVLYHNMGVFSNLSTCCLGWQTCLA